MSLVETIFFHSHFFKPSLQLEGANILRKIWFLLEETIFSGVFRYWFVRMEEALRSLILVEADLELITKFVLLFRVFSFGEYNSWN